ncbi:cellulose synthase subunit BcsC-related outer membrane protein [Cupriavidus pauculus]|uniref:cellulose synthase subunit BcsC-related outer membrane protein n=1 Tax=Cupriavidus pauculus TaxID=82633 RepID=UPI001EE19663|nr:cellulose synthase subunit BcsC-related outer membrane protein [Cupriavidus pauculus]GJG96318.1 tetratricopeptide repeat protein [Cupriavidus pauculus]
MPRNALAPTLALLLATPAMPAFAADPAPTPAPQAAPSAQMAQLLAAARMWEAKNRTDMARGILDKALLIDPNQPEALKLLGLIEIRSNRPAEAEKLLRKLRAAAPDSAATLELDDAYRIATRDKREMANIQLLSRSGHDEEAVQRLEKLFPRGAPAGSLARTYYRVLSGTPAGRTRAIAELRQRIRANPNDMQLKLTLGDLLTDREGTRQEGMALLYEVTQRPDGDRTTALDIWRRTLYRVNEDPAYYVWFERYLKEVPDDKPTQETLAALGKKVTAQRKLEADPAYQARQRGLAQLERGQLKDADIALQKAYQKRRNDAEVVGGLGLVRLREGRHDEARELFTRANQLDPSNKWRSLIATATFWGTVAKAREANRQGKPADAERLARQALAQQPDNADAQHILAEALVAQNRNQEAEAMLRQMLARPKPDIDALRLLVQVLQKEGRDAEVDPLIASQTSRMQGSAAELRAMRADLLSVRADQSLARQARSPAMRDLEEAIRLRPDDPWMRFTLARVYRDVNLPALGRSVMDDGMRVAPGNDMRYATALYLNSVDDIDAAATTLAAVPEAQRSEGMRNLSHNLAAQQMLRDARQLVAQGRDDEARRLLDQAAVEAKDDPHMLASIGREWIALGETDKGLRLVSDWLAAHPDAPNQDIRLRYAELLAAADRDDALRQWIAESTALPGITAEQRADFADQSLRLALRDTDRQIEAGDLRRAHDVLYAVPAAQQTDRRWLLELADLRQAGGDYRGAAEAARQVLATAPHDAGAQLTLARQYELMGQTSQALDIVRTVLAETPEDDIDTRLSVARRFTAMRREDEAAQVVDALDARFPNRADITVQRGRIAQSRGDFDEAADIYRAALPLEQRESVLPGPDGTPAQRALAGLEARRDGEVATAVMQSNKSGDDGISRLHATEIPLYVRVPHGYTGHAFFHADTVLLDAGTLHGGDPVRNLQFGKIPALGNAGLGNIGQTDKGVALAAGYEYDGAYNSWRADIGTTPLGFLESTVVGGFRYRADLGVQSVSVDVSRRAQTSSLISYAGARDPVTGETWGGIVRNGVHLRYARDVGRLGLFADVGAGLYTGENVKTNRELTLRTGFDVPVYTQRDQRVTSGLVLNWWHYSENQRFYTFGHGGYYSPQRYVSVGIPLDWTGRYAKWSWRLLGSAGWSWTYEDAAPFFPTRPDLQAMSGNATYGGGSGGGFSYTIGATVEYTFAPHWVVGAGFSIDRSRDYAPNRAMAWLRYLFDKRQLPVPFPPTPVRPYSAY